MHFRASVLAVSSVIFFACAPPVEDGILTENESELAADANANAPVWHPTEKADAEDGGAVEDIGSDLVAPIVWPDSGPSTISDAGVAVADSQAPYDAGADSGVVTDCFNPNATAGRTLPLLGSAAQKGVCSHDQVKTLASECAKGVTPCRTAAAAAGACGTCALTELDAAPPGSRTTGPLYIQNGTLSSNTSACTYLVKGTDPRGMKDYEACYADACGSCEDSNSLVACSSKGMSTCDPLRELPHVARDPSSASCSSVRGAIDAFCGSGNGIDAYDTDPDFYPSGFAPTTPCGNPSDTAFEPGALCGTEVTVALSCTIDDFAWGTGAGYPTYPPTYASRTTVTFPSSTRVRLLRQGWAVPVGREWGGEREGPDGTSQVALTTPTAFPSGFLDLAAQMVRAVRPSVELTSWTIKNPGHRCGGTDTSSTKYSCRHSFEPWTNAGGRWFGDVAVELVPHAFHIRMEAYRVRTYAGLAASAVCTGTYAIP